MSGPARAVALRGSLALAPQGDGIYADASARQFVCRRPAGEVRDFAFVRPLKPPIPGGVEDRNNLDDIAHNSMDDDVWQTGDGKKSGSTQTGRPE
jgi:hypothetical protein